MFRAVLANTKLSFQILGFSFVSWELSPTINAVLSLWPLGEACAGLCPWRQQRSDTVWTAESSLDESQRPGTVGTEG